MATEKAAEDGGDLRQHHPLNLIAEMKKNKWARTRREWEFRSCAKLTAKVFRRAKRVVARGSYNGGENGGGSSRYGWLGMLGAELWFGFYWLLTQSLRWNRVHRHTFRDRLLLRYVTNLV
ncbi:hypothetical protein HAX54_030510 [Datura stramonium]|uniref:Uncharacterized protein n=1 Tax=Datura stramonium TaxID=4076 RepID=A0ABS8SB27_DATST|nr:hypothetical protein [Datura stramonium]